MGWLVEWVGEWKLNDGALCLSGVHNFSSTCEVIRIRAVFGVNDWPGGGDNYAVCPSVCSTDMLWRIVC